MEGMSFEVPNDNRISISFVFLKSKNKKNYVWHFFAFIIFPTYHSVIVINYLWSFTK